MSLLPTAHAGQSFGSRRIDFFTVSGEITVSEPGFCRVTDGDGVVHDIKLLERSAVFDTGDTASVLRVQSGPKRRSRPAALIDHTKGVWMRSARDATQLLARSGITRALNWWVSVLVLAALAIALAWPSLHLFLTELNLAMMAGVPSFNLLSEMAVQWPGLASWRLEDSLSSGLRDLVASFNAVPMQNLTEWGLAVAATILIIITYFARSWRLLYLPVLAGLCVISGVILSSPVASLSMIGGAIAFFMLGGMINRFRDSGRFGARVERLAEYVLNHPPEEGVRTTAPAAVKQAEPEPVIALPAAAAASAIAAASAVAEGEVDADPAREDDSEPEQAGQAGTVAAEPEPTGPARRDDSQTHGEIAADTAPQPDGDDVPEDDLPSLDDVAAAAALTEQERETGVSSDPVQPDALDDDRTMPVASPPPMPFAADEEPAEPEAEAEAEPEPEPEPEPAPEPVAEAEVEIEAEAADSQPETAPRPAAPEIDDPLIEDDGDPMVERSLSDFAPGAPELDIDDDDART